MSSMASSLVQRTLSLPSSPFYSHRRPAFYSSLTSFPSTALTHKPILLRSPVKPNSPLSPQVAPFKVPHNIVYTDADENLKRALQSEIDWVQQEEGYGQGVVSPYEFLFEIIDNPDDSTIILLREFAGESIQVFVSMNFDEWEYEEANEVDTKDDDSDSSIQTYFSLVVLIDKGDGLSLKICCSLDEDELEIESLIMNKPSISHCHDPYQGPPFWDLDESLKNAFYEYLKVRGINSFMFCTLKEYMIYKEERQCLAWLKNMKKFIEKSKVMSSPKSRLPLSKRLAWRRNVKIE